MEVKIHLPKLLGEGCVLQQGENTRIWGQYLPGEIVTITFQGEKRETLCHEKGDFSCSIRCAKTGGPFPLELSAGGQTLLRRVYVGEVFVCAGQSNMELPISRVRERFPKEGGSSWVHHYKIGEEAAFSPLGDHTHGVWRICKGRALENVSALAYFFGKYISESRGVPLGLINASKGGSPAQAWMSREALGDFPQYVKEAQLFSREDYSREYFDSLERAEARWQRALQEAGEKERNGQGDKVWENIRLPGFFQGPLQDFSGLLVFRKRFVIKPGQSREGMLRLGTLTDSDETFVNGIKAGETTYAYPPRRYPLGEDILKEGENEIRIFLACRQGGGRFTPDKPYDLYLSSGETIDLRGDWEYRMLAEMDPAPEQDFMIRKATALFNGMLSPCFPMTVRGVLWYQGESNDKAPEEYEVLLKSLILDWRQHWHQERLPFILCQLPACGVDITKGAWPLLRQAQERAASLPDTVCTVNLDLGEWNDLHPVNKKEAARRAFLAARHLIYHAEGIWQGPRLVKASQTGEEVRLRFNPGEGSSLSLVCGGRPDFFEIAGEDGRFRPVEARIAGNQVILAAGEARFVRYAWQDCPLGGLLCNTKGLPAPPFWRAVTKENLEI
mgnify:CR=1 FL=1